MRGKIKRPFYAKIKSWLLGLFQLTDHAVVRVYSGYGNSSNCTVFGHVLARSPLPRRRYRQNMFINAIALLRLFMVRPSANASVRMLWDGITYNTQSETDGFFRFDWVPAKALAPGWHTVQIDLIHPFSGSMITSGNGSIFIPFPNQYAFISDIDDTFLISHSSKFARRMKVLLTKNAHSRKPFEGVVHHYQLLSKAHASANTSNPFFYVSSSEWNLYNYIQTFSEKNGLPDGIFLLSQIKRFSQVFKTGQGKHATKFMRISRVLEAYPGHQFVLLGDDTQEDPNIYASVAAHFKDRIFAVYIRHIELKNKTAVTEKIKVIVQSGVHCCYFTHSSDAVEHSRAIGLIE